MNWFPIKDILSPNYQAALRVGKQIKLNAPELTRQSNSHQYSHQTILASRFREAYFV